MLLSRILKCRFVLCCFDPVHRWCAPSQLCPSAVYYTLLYTLLLYISSTAHFSHLHHGMVLDKLPLCRGCRKDLFVTGWYVVVGPLSGVYKPGLPSTRCRFVWWSSEQWPSISCLSGSLCCDLWSLRFYLLILLWFLVVSDLQLRPLVEQWLPLVVIACSYFLLKDEIQYTEDMWIQQFEVFACRDRVQWGFSVVWWFQDLI